MRLSLQLLLLNFSCLAGIALVEVPAPAPAAPPASLRLVREAPADAAAAGARCYSLGSFTSTQESGRFAAALRELGYDARVSLREVEAAPDYWVHLPPFASEATALRRLEELKARGVDSYLISGGDLAQGLSLGQFSRRAEAEALRQRVTALGYAAEIREVPRRYGEIWVDMAGAGQGAAWDTLLRQHPGLRQVEKSCETIAQQNEFP